MTCSVSQHSREVFVFSPLCPRISWYPKFVFRMLHSIMSTLLMPSYFNDSASFKDHFFEHKSNKYFPWQIIISLAIWVLNATRNSQRNSPVCLLCTDRLRPRLSINLLVLTIESWSLAFLFHISLNARDTLLFCSCVFGIHLIDY